MGFRDTLTPAEQGTLPFPFFFNVIRAVGKNCPNLSDDVKLIHFLLINFYEALGRRFRWEKPKGEISFDSGVYSAATENWITKCQLDITFRGGINPGSALDKRIDRVRNKEDFKSSITKTTYTLATLNIVVERINPAIFLALPIFVPVVTGAVPPPSPDIVIK